MAFYLNVCPSKVYTCSLNGLGNIQLNYLGIAIVHEIEYHVLV
jgi:hypothetical protein